MSSAELDLVGKPDDKKWRPGYGTYLVTATYLGGWNNLLATSADDPTQTGNAVFGAFTYQKDPGAGSHPDNPNRELDIIEAGRFNDRSLSDSTNAQNTLQHFYEPPGSGSIYDNPNLHRITIPHDPTTITAVIEWQDGGKPVYFLDYNGPVTLDDLKTATPSVKPWETDSEQDHLIPSNSTDDDASLHQTVHLNLWRSESGPNHVVPIPDTTDITVQVDNFQYDPKIIIPIPS